MTKKTTTKKTVSKQNTTKAVTNAMSSGRVRIHNPVTNSYYQVRRRSTSAGKKGTIIGKWSSKSPKKNK
jgi:methyl coenzyme M reductase subunit C